MRHRSLRTWRAAIGVGLALTWVLLATSQDRPVAPPADRGKQAPSPAARGPAANSSFTAANYEEHLRKLRRRIPADGFTVVVVPPFVVVGDEPPETVRRRAEHTVKWAVDRLKDAYFTKDPKQILDIWLFKDKASYREHCKGIFHKTPDTPFGYYSHEDGALVMDISTGGGTLVHEIVHPFMAANFPECPTWLNEGLGSLYEQCGEENGRIHGYPNWRLPGLQQAIRKGQLPNFATLCAMSETEFYDKDKGTNYGQARYLCYYLQERDLLGRFYHRFRTNSGKDPTGYDTLQAVLGRPDMDAFQRQWEAYVLKLSAP